jgi:aldehyde dehydrogenase (NAD+)
VTGLDLLEEQRQFFQSGATQPIRSRKENLLRLREALLSHETSLMEGLKDDLGKQSLEAYGSEIGYVHQEINLALRSLRRWNRPQRVPTELIAFPGRSRVYRDPYGSVLILAPWNYPIQLALVPAVSALAGGNTVIIKPSEIAAASAAALKTMFDEVFPAQVAAVVLGDGAVASDLCGLAFNKIFFTGSSRVGRLVLAKAAPHLTPVTLELGGKNPALVDRSARLTGAARKIVWGKFLNAGQTCVAPDYLLVERSVAATFVDRLKEAVHSFFGEDPSGSPRYSRVVSAAHLERLQGLIDRELIVAGGQVDPKERYISPTILYPVRWDHPVMEEEIFGPVLPVLEMETLDEGFSLVRSLPRPLSAYLFSRRREARREFLRQIPFGSGGINTVVVQQVSRFLPFGGIGESGMGNYHGRTGFQCFTHPRGVLRQYPLFDLELIYPDRRIGMGLIRRAMGHPRGNRHRGSWRAP